MKTVSLYIIILFTLAGCWQNKVVTANYKKELGAYRSKYKADFLSNPRSPLKEEDLSLLEFYPADPSWKLVCYCIPAKDAKPFEMPTYSGVSRTYILHSMVECTHNGNKFGLNLYKNIHQPINPLYKNHLFLPFKDLTNSETTYGGGRYINLLDTDINDGTIIIDFNKSYNPWCAYSEGYNCPIPPTDNHLDIMVRAGEMLFQGKHKTP